MSQTNPPAQRAGAPEALLPRTLDELAGDVTAATAQLRAHLQHRPAKTLPDERAVQKFLAYEIAHLTTWHNTYTDLEKALGGRVVLPDAAPRTVRALRHAITQIAAGLHQALDGVIAADAALDSGAA
ncbi:hypothetical protein R8Z50_22775 [Longispora sp. K20-0274]|uniref:hypothetical protein n=1 Tax=Longispora sp. K20-0274 TaxID=3088255 RepID=UPI00399BD586